ncbi:MAG: ABC-type sugar transport system ATPase subunit [Paracoccaceae bacterium]|jgi:ABC-type sugar transport system ATPase subunit
MADDQMISFTKSFGDNEVIHSVDLKDEDNEFMDCVGPSGCGKSTLLSLIARLEDFNELESFPERMSQ